MLEEPADGELRYLINLPFPVSTSRLWQLVIFPDDKYVHITHVQYNSNKQADALYMTQKWQLKAWAERPVKLGKFKIDITLSAALRRKSQDGDNFIKCVLDWLQRVEIIDNDCDCESGSWGWGLAPEGCCIVVWGKPWKVKS